MEHSGWKRKYSDVSVTEGEKVFVQLLIYCGIRCYMQKGNKWNEQKYELLFYCM